MALWTPKPKKARRSHKTPQQVAQEQREILAMGFDYKTMQLTPLPTPQERIDSDPELQQFLKDV